MKINFNTSKLVSALNEVQCRCTARIYDAVSIRRIDEKFIQMLLNMRIPKKIIYGYTVGFGRGYNKKWGESIRTILIQKGGIYLTHLKRDGCGEKSRAALTKEAKNELAKTMEVYVLERY